jgi:hypothetical protein
MTRRRGRLAALALLAAQLFGSSAVGLLHAREPFDAPRHIESASSDQCLVIHDATRCVTCAFAHARAVAPAPTVFLPALLPVRRTASPVIADPVALAAHPSADARAPPAPQG